MFKNPLTHRKLAILFLLHCISVTMLCAQPPLKSMPLDNSAAQFPEASAYADADLTYKIIDAANNTFCYDIYAGGRLMIHQTSAPGLPGNEGFKSEEDAAKVARMVIEKIRKGEMPPTVTNDEMKNLNVIK
ncbi:MAG: DUF4907 domain-containing protein [Chitinophagales bacterium]|nr:DUF4907 domain-containing protein [Chitinophagales bacterium]